MTNSCEESERYKVLLYTHENHNDLIISQS